MAEEGSRSPQGGKRWLVACLAVLLGVVIYSDSLEPVVQTFGLAHASISSQAGQRILVVDSLPSADAPSVQTVFQGEIWGRHSYKVGVFLLPFLILTAAMGGLAHLLSTHVSSAGSRFFHLGRGSALPPVGLWVALFLGGCFAAWAVERPFPPAFALFPLVATMLASALIAASPRPSAGMTARAFGALAATRWFWLGFLALTPDGLFRYEGLTDTMRPLEVPAPALLACVSALLALHWATRACHKVDFDRFSGDVGYLDAEVRRLTLLAVQELWLLLPAVLMGAVVSSVRIEYLAPYLLSSVVCALLMRWTIQPKAPAAVRVLARLTTLALILILPFAASLPDVLPISSLPLVGCLMLVALGLVLGRPWLPTHEITEPVSQRVPAEELAVRPWRLTPTFALLGLLTVSVVGFALRGGLPLPSSDPILAKAQAELAGTFGPQARLLRSNGQALLVGCNLDVARLSLAAEIVSAHLSDTETRVVSVRTRRWERIGRIFLALTVALFLVLPTYLLTVAAPGPSSRVYMAFCAIIGGANGAFAIGSAMGWFWMDPAPHLAAFLLSSGLGWLGLGYARAWFDGRVTPQQVVKPRLATASNTPA